MKSVTDPSPISSRTVNESMSRFLHRVVAKKKKKKKGEEKSRNERIDDDADRLLG